MCRGLCMVLMLSGCWVRRGLGQFYHHSPYPETQWLREASRLLLQASSSPSAVRFVPLGFQSPVSLPPDFLSSYQCVCAIERGVKNKAQPSTPSSKHQLSKNSSLATGLSLEPGWPEGWNLERLLSQPGRPQAKRPRHPTWPLSLWS